MLWLVESLTQQRLADEHQGEGAAAVEVASGEEAQILEGVVGEHVCLVDQEDGAFGQATQMGDEACGGVALEAGRAQSAQCGQM